MVQHPRHHIAEDHGDQRWHFCRKIPTFGQPSDRRPLQPSGRVRHPLGSVAPNLASDTLVALLVGSANIDKREIVGIGSGKVEIFPVELEFGSLGGNKTLGGLCRSRVNKAGRRNDQQVQEGRN